MKIPFTKAHGARNDFLLTWRGELHKCDARDYDFPTVARAICDRHTGIGADGWLLVKQDSDADARIDLFNSDGSTSPISGNGTRCAAAFLIEAGHASEHLRIATGAGVKHLDLLQRDGRRLVFEMNMGPARIDELHASMLGRDAVILDVGNPQCAVFVEHFDFDWHSVGAAIERDARFPYRTNVSFLKVLDRHTLDLRFFERGAGVTMSSGTGSTGAAAAAAARGLVDHNVQVQTPAGPLHLRWRGEDILLAGPAEIIGSGEFYLDQAGHDWEVK
jgi:diaminopimelate epimerase